MIIDVPSDEDDDVRFLANLNGLVARLVSERTPQLVYVVRVNKWFDHKWLRFSGKGRVGFEGVRLSHDTALDSFWQNQLTFPPFNPSQIGNQVGWRRSDRGDYKPVSDEQPPHGAARRHSSTNLHKRVKNFTQSGVFVWFSSHTKSTKRASLLVYAVEGDEEVAWYASFGGKGDWGVDRVKGINQETVQEWLPLG
jgi:hypothetical protein